MFLTTCLEMTGSKLDWKGSIGVSGEKRKHFVDGWRSCPREQYSWRKRDAEGTWDNELEISATETKVEQQRW